MKPALRPRARTRTSCLALVLATAAVLLSSSAPASADAFLELGNGERVYSTGVDVAAGVDQRYAM